MAIGLEPGASGTGSGGMPTLRAQFIRRGFRLALYTVLWNVLEGVDRGVLGNRGRLDRADRIRH